MTEPEQRPLPHPTPAPQAEDSRAPTPGPLPNYSLSTRCPACGDETYRLACKVRCPRCGFMWDCSEV